MATSLDVLQKYIDESSEALIRAEKIKEQGRVDDAKAIEAEWNGASAINALYVNVDSFVNSDA